MPFVPNRGLASGLRDYNLLPAPYAVTQTLVLNGGRSFPNVFRFQNPYIKKAYIAQEPAHVTQITTWPQSIPPTLAPRISRAPITRNEGSDPFFGWQRNHSYRKASAGKILAADQDGYSVATNETPTATAATITPSITRGANGT